MFGTDGRNMLNGLYGRRLMSSGPEFGFSGTTGGCMLIRINLCGKSLPGAEKAGIENIEIKSLISLHFYYKHYLILSDKCGR